MASISISTPAAMLILTILVACLGVPAVAQGPRREEQGIVARSNQYERWLDEDVPWIITPAEWMAFHRLQTERERDRFIEEFWRRRNPNPDLPRNEYKEEHYRRVAYANAHFAFGTPGCKTDRGRIYVLHGPPDSIKTSVGAGKHRRQLWSYKSFTDTTGSIGFAFTDLCDCGDYQLESALGQ